VIFISSEADRREIGIPADIKHCYLRPAMSKSFNIEHKIFIAAPMEKVIAVLSDVGKWSEWTKSISKSEILDGKKFSVGAKIKIYQPKLSPAVWVVKETSKDLLVWIKESPGLKISAKHFLESTNEGTSFVNSISYEGFFARLAYSVSRSLTEKYIAMEANGLKSVCEKKQTSIPPHTISAF
jgi:hypothetical protein